MLGSEEASAKRRVVVPKSEKLYVYASILYGFFALNEIRHLLARNPHYSNPQWHWTIWNQLFATLFCIWICFEIWSAVSNRIEKTVCILTIAYFALTIPSLLYLRGYDWLPLVKSQWIFAALMSTAAILVFLRTFQVFHRHEAVSR